MTQTQQKANSEQRSARARCPRTAWCPILSACAVAGVVLSSTPARAQSQPQTDKLLHAGASAAVVDVVWAGCALLDQPLWVRAVAGVSAGVVVGVGKEIYDAAGYGDPDVNDLVFDGFGIGLGVAFALLAETAARHGDVAEAPIAPAAP